MSELLARAAAEFGTPLWAYDPDVVRERIARLSRFDVVRYAQKANSNTHLLRLMREAGVCVDAVSLGELERALAAGYRPGGDPSPVVFTADLLDRPTLRRVAELKVPVNAGSPDMLEQLGRVSPGHPVWLRINPGFGHGHSNKTNTGGPHSKHGIWHEDLHESLRHLDRYGLDLVGLHMHIGSGVDYAHLESVCEAMLKQARMLGRDIRAVSAGGGLSVPYEPGAPEVDVDRYFDSWDAVRRELESEFGHAVQLEIEPGRYLVAGSGTLVSEVRAEKRMGPNRFVLVDAGFNDLMRPALYGSRHRVTALAPDGTPRPGEGTDTVLAGPLCESGDIFTQQADGAVDFVPLPAVEVGDLVVFHDTGAYGASMSSTYNSRPLAAEVLLSAEGPRLIRRRQTIEDLMALEEPAEA
ncbi:diaminopimelate decarboxylase [Streptomyces roseicoloratus]|uniref:Diaminopimelate decarboxylase n=1 Tax=Streptomyces roseicoloratus TaxID=2508722 RepID=A0ABY9RUX2_9ACTN|nr:diaminopimelate decarboxylase [Streptomyces roseicoloratus]WMX45981.1 diaminopimelate decarboxylase [Streptomyces roseicoloratus]